MSNEDKAAKAAEKEQIEACRKALEPLARISPKGERKASHKQKDGDQEEFTGEYRVCRVRRTAVITAADIEAAAKCREGETTLAACQKALRPLARLPRDERMEDAKAPIYTFEDVNGAPVHISNAMIEAAEALLG